MPPADQITATGSIAEGPGDVTYVDDQGNNRVLKVAGGQVSVFAGTGVQGYTGDGGPATQAELSLPEGVATDAQGDVYIADSANGVIREVTPDGTITTVVGSGSNNGYCANWVEGAPALQARINPGQVAVSPSGQLYWTDVCGRIGTLVNGDIETAASPGGFGDPGPSFLAFDASGNLYFSIGDAIQELSTSGSITTIAGSIQTAGFSGDGGPATQATFDNIGGLAFDSAGDLFLADEGYNRRIREITPDGIVHTVVGAGPVRELCSDSPAPGLSVGLNGPTSVAIDSNDDVLIGSGGPALLRMTAAGMVSNMLCGPMLPNEEAGGCNPSELCSQPRKGEPVNVASGDFYSRETDLSIPGRGIPLVMSRAYDAFTASSDTSPGPLGYGWASSYGMSLQQDPYTGDVTITQEDGSQVLFVPNGSGTFVSPTRVLATLAQNSDGSWTFIRKARETFSFNPAGELTAIQDLNGYTTTLSYDSQGRLTNVTDPADRALTFSYDSSNRITQVSEPAGRTVKYGYDANGNLATVTDLDGGTTTYGYDPAHRLTSVTDPRGHTVLTNSYDSAGRVAWQTDALGRKTTFSYTPGETTTTTPAGNQTQDLFAGGLLAEEIQGAGTPQQATWQYQYDPITSGVASITDPNGHTTTKTYNSAGDVLTSTDPLNHTTTYTYDGLNDVTSVTDPNGTTTTSTYDGAGNLLSVSTPLAGTNQTQTETYTYEDGSHPGDVTAITDPDENTTVLTYDQYGDLASSTDAAGDETTYTYDQVGRRTSMVSPDGNAAGANPTAYTTIYTYDPAGHLLTETNPLGHATTNTYDADQNLATTTDADGNTTTYTYDNANELTTTTRADGTTINRTYDADGNAASQTDGAQHTTAYTYDPLDRLASTTDPLNRTTSYSYDGAGNRTSVTDAAGRTTTYAYDADNHLTSITYSDGQTPNVSYGYDNDGERTSMTDGTGTSHYSYDSLNRLTSTTDGAGDTIGYTYDLANDQTGITYPNGKTVTRTFDQANRLASVTDWLGNTTSFSYDPNSNLTSMTFPASTGNVDTYGYNAADELKSINMAQGPSTLASLAYTRDPLGQVTTESQIGLPGSASTSYSYTKLNQLATAGPTNYSYDNGGNATSAPEGQQSYDAADQLQNMTEGGDAANFTYDQLGERTTGALPAAGSFGYTYDQAQRLTKATTTSTQPAIAAGQGQSIALKSDGSVWAWGDNSAGQLGNGTTTSSQTPVQVSDIGSATAVAAGDDHSVALESDGSVWAWGDNAAGQLGNGTTTSSSTPVQVNGLQSVSAIAAGGNHTVAVKSDGTVWAWGGNSDGQLGDGTTINSSSPVQVTGLTGVTAVAAGADDTIALKSDGTVWAWGDNSDGQLGDGTTTNSSSPVQVTGLSGITAVASGAYHTLAVKSDGTVWTWGDNSDGQLGDGTTTNSSIPVQVTGLTGVTRIAAGNDHTVAAESNGTAWAWGDNSVGQLGNGSTTNATTPVAVNGTATRTSPPTAPNCAGKTVGGCYAAAKVAGFTNVHAIAVATGHAVESNGGCLFRPSYFSAKVTATTLGNVEGCNDGNPDQNPLPGQTGTTFSFAYDADNSGADNVECGAGGSHTISAGSDQTSGSDPGWCDYGTFTVGNEPGGFEADTQTWPAQGTPGTAAVAAGGDHTLLATSTGTLQATGDNALGELGNNTTLNANSPTPVTDIASISVPASTTYTYNGDGLRTSSTSAGTTISFTWDQTASLPLVLTDTDNSYVYGPDDVPIEQISNSGTPSYLHHDQLDSTRLITDQNGNLAGSFTYNPYGTLSASTGTATTPMGYAGQYTDAETGLQFLRARYYDPATGQFLTQDPLESVSGAPYIYAGDDPTNVTDPSGLLCLGGVCLGFHPVAGLEGGANFFAGMANEFVATVSLGELHIAAPFCGGVLSLSAKIGGWDFSTALGIATGAGTSSGVHWLLDGLKVSGVKIGPILAPLLGGGVGATAEGLASNQTGPATFAKGVLAGFLGELTTAGVPGTSAQAVAGFASELVGMLVG